MFLNGVLAQTIFDIPLPQSSPWWAVILILFASALAFVMRQSMNNRTLTVQTQLSINLKKQQNDFQLKMDAMLQEKAQDTANATAIQSLANTLSKAISGLQETVRTFAEQRREATQAIRENTEVYRQANAVTEQQNKQIDELLQQMRPLTTAIPDAISSIVSTFTRTEQTILAAVERSMDIGIVVIDKDERITASNPRLRRCSRRTRCRRKSHRSFACTPSPIARSFHAPIESVTGCCWTNTP